MKLNLFYEGKNCKYKPLKMFKAVGLIVVLVALIDINTVDGILSYKKNEIIQKLNLHIFPYRILAILKGTESKSKCCT